MSINFTFVGSYRLQHLPFETKIFKLLQYVAIYFDIATQIRTFEKCSFIKPPTSNNIPKVAVQHIKMIFVQPQIEGLNS